MKPLIGVTSSYNTAEKNYTLPDSYVNAVERAGGTPILLPPTMEADTARHLQLVDAIVLTGGVDVDPFLYGDLPIPQQGAIDPLRDAYELKLTRQALEQGKPILAICRGCQVLNVAAGGTLYQDLNVQVKGSMKHNQQAPTWYGSHTADLKEGSRLHGVYGKEKVAVNSFHHQGIKNCAPGFTETAWANDGVVEGMEYEGKPWVVGVQWHPERMIDGEHLKIFQAFIKAAQA